jgi:ABC-type dipeptide/oligopeptide/nickel transport system permease component
VTQIIIIALAFMITLPLLFIIYYIFKRGITRVNWTFLTHIPKPVGETGGGIVNALIGSIITVLLAAIIAIPFGLMGGIYLSENRTSRLSYWSRLPIIAGSSLNSHWHCCLFLDSKTFGTFSTFGKCSVGHHDVTHPDACYGRNLKLIPSTLRGWFALMLITR